MATRVLSFIACIAFNSFTAFASQDAVISVGDDISVSVYNEPDLSVKAKVDQRGAIQLPLIGWIAVAGLSTDQVSEDITERLKDGYLVNPSVIVKIDAHLPVYVNGEVRKPGAFVYTVGLTVDQAVALAGGLKDRASREKWYVLRGVEKKRIKVSGDMLLMPGDTLEIAESLF